MIEEGEEEPYEPDARARGEGEKGKRRECRLTDKEEVEKAKFFFDGGKARSQKVFMEQSSIRINSQEGMVEKLIGVISFLLFFCHSLLPGLVKPVRTVFSGRVLEVWLSAWTTATIKTN